MKQKKLEKILYVKNDMDGEQSFLRFVRANQELFVPLEEPVSVEKIQKAVKPYGTAYCMLISARDNTLAMAQQMGLAAAAYDNPAIEGQDLFGADTLIEDFSEVDRKYLQDVYKRFHGIPWEIAQTKRCRIREITMDDMAELFRLYEQPHMTDYMEPLRSWEEELAYEKAYIENMYGFYGYGMWVVIERKSGKLIGRAGLEHRVYEENGEMELELGYAIATQYQKKGYATEVCKAILSYAAEQLNASKINCLIDRKNIPSIRLAQKLGFRLMEETCVTGSPMLRYVRYEHNPG